MGTTVSKAMKRPSVDVEFSGCLTMSEVARSVRPAVSRPAVFRWIKTRKLIAYRGRAAGRYLITLTHLKHFARKHGKTWTLTRPNHR